MNEKDKSNDYLNIDWPLWLWIKVRDIYESVKKSTFLIINKIKF